MQKVFDALVDGYLLDKVGISENFLGLALTQNLKENLVKLFEEKKLISAKTGNGNETNLNALVRSDKIFGWTEFMKIQTKTLFSMSWMPSFYFLTKLATRASQAMNSIMLYTKKEVSTKNIWINSNPTPADNTP